MGHTSDANLTREPVAIIGVGCRFPGADDLQSLWRILRDGIETVGEYPGGRFSSVDRLYDAKAGARNGILTRRGGFLKDLDLFDADFFGISPREAVLLDPQHRLLLELGWEALEDAGLPLGVLAGSRTGVFVGQWTSDFEACINELSDPQLYSTTGSGRYAAAARLAYHFDLRGPNLTLDTACSSSLVAVHLACQSLRTGESELALAAGVNLILRPEITLAYGSAGMLSPDGRCKFGDASANGYVRSEAGGVVVLKLLGRALADRDPIHAILRGSSTNNDGSSSGLLVSPSREGQATMIRAALHDAGISAAQLDYIEAHGTGTAAGDPVELEAIGCVLADAPRNRPCFVGSVKTNLGHAEAAAGMAGLCKVIVSLQHASIPATLHFREPNPNIQWSRLPLTMSVESHPWPHVGERRIASVNSFGITGTNAHAIVENAPARISPCNEPERARLYVLSARTPAALEQTAAGWRARINEETLGPPSMADLAYTAAVRRTFHPFRLAVVAKNTRDLDAQLAAWLEHEPTDRVHSGKTLGIRRRVVFVFPGQGGQWLGMGRELFDMEPVFRDAITRCDRALRPHTGWSLVDAIMDPAAAGTGEIDWVQPVLFAVMIALAELWRSWGVEPDAVVGHSMGEVAAAVVCGALSLEDGAAVISKRSGLMKTVSGRGLMALAALTFADAKEFVRAYGGRVSVAANNSPSSTILSGDADAVEEAIAALELREIFCRRIQVDVASHCAQMYPIAPELERNLTSIVPRRAQIPLYSTSTGCIEDGFSLGASYWSRNLREPVLFADAVQHLLRDGFQTFIEINAHPVLLSEIDEGARHAGKQILATASLRRDKEQLPEMLASLGKLHVSGQPINFSSLYPAGECLRLPAYRWQRDRYWPEQNPAGGSRFTRRGPHPSLGSRMESSLDPGTHLCEVEFRPPADRLEAVAWCLDLVVAASCEILDTREIALEDVRFQTMVAPSDSGQLAVFRHSDATYRFRLSAKAGEAWNICCEGNVRSGDFSGAPPIAGLLERSVPSSHPLTACLQAAAESLGYMDGEADWSVSRIDRIERFCGDDSEQMKIGAAAGPGNETCAYGEVRQHSGSCMVRMVGVQFDIPRSPDCAKHVYQWQWVEIESPSICHPRSGAFVIVGDAALSDKIAGCLRSRNVECVVASDSASVRDVVDSLESPCKAIVWISGKRSSEPESAIEQLWDVFSLVRSIAAGDGGSPPSFWLITTGAHEIGSNLAHPAHLNPPCASQTAVWGLARAIASAHPELSCISIDLSPLPDSRELELLERFAAGNLPEEQIAIRGTKCYGLRLERRLETDQPNVPLKKDVTYLVTGGFGDLGLTLAAFLAERGARHIALVGRRPPGTAALKKIALIESLGAEIRGFQADVANYSEIASVLKEISNSIAPLKGIFHLAGVTQVALLANFTHESLEQVMRPKVFGSWNLHCLTAASDLDYFVMYSSIAAVCSQPGQGGYAASNAYLDGLATLRCVSGLAGASVQWGPWKNAGMIRESGAARGLLALGEQGIGTLNTETALDGLHRILARPVPVAFIAPVDWKRFAAAFAGKTSPLFSRLVEPQARMPQAESGMRDQLASLPPPERAARLEAHLKSIVAGVLKSKISRIDSTRRFGSLGVDSLMAVEIARRVSNTLGARLPATAVFNFPTLELLTKEVARRLELATSPGASQRSAGAGSPNIRIEPSLPKIAQMTEEEALQSLLRAVESQ